METLEIAKELEKVGIENDNAYKIAETINGKSGLATKEDIHNLDKKIDLVNANLDNKIEVVKSELKGDIHNLDKKIDLVNVNLKEDIHNLDKKIDLVNANLDNKIEVVKSELKGDMKLLKWMLGIIFACVVYPIIKSLLTT